MSFHGLSACQNLGDKAVRDRIDTKEELIEKYMIRESILRRDLWRKKEVFDTFIPEGVQKDRENETCSFETSGLSDGDVGGFVKEETVEKEEVLLISDYGYDLLRYHMFYLGSDPESLISTAFKVAEGSCRETRCRGMPVAASDFSGETGYGIEISHFRRVSSGHWKLEDYQRLEGLSEDLAASKTFFREIVEGRVYPCSLWDLFEDWSENF